MPGKDKRKREYDDEEERSTKLTKASVPRRPVWKNRDDNDDEVSESYMLMEIIEEDGEDGKDCMGADEVDCIIEADAELWSSSLP